MAQPWSAWQTQFATARRYPGAKRRQHNAVPSGSMAVLPLHAGRQPLSGAPRQHGLAAGLLPIRQRLSYGSLKSGVARGAFFGACTAPLMAWMTPAFARAIWHRRGC